MKARLSILFVNCLTYVAGLHADVFSRANRPEKREKPMTVVGHEALNVLVFSNSSMRISLADSSSRRNGYNGLYPLRTIY